MQINSKLLQRLISNFQAPSLLSSFNVRRKKPIRGPSICSSLFLPPFPKAGLLASLTGEISGSAGELQTKINPLYHYSAYQFQIPPMDHMDGEHLLKLCHLKNLHRKLEKEVAVHGELINHLQSKLDSMQVETELSFNSYKEELQEVNYLPDVQRKRTMNLSMKREASEKELEKVINAADVQHKRSASKIAFLKNKYALLREFSSIVEEQKRKRRMWKWVIPSVGLIAVVASIVYAARRR